MWCFLPWSYGERTYTQAHTHAHTYTELQSLGQNIKLQPLDISILSPLQFFLSCLYALSPTAAAGSPHYAVTWETLFSAYYCYCASPPCLSGDAQHRVMDHHREYLPGKTAASWSPPFLLPVGKERKPHQTTQLPENPKGKEKYILPRALLFGKKGVKFATDGVGTKAGHGVGGVGGGGGQRPKESLQI